MQELYSLDTTVAAGAPCTFDNVALDKGCTSELVSASTIQFNKRGVYKLSFNADAAAASTLQLYKNGVPQPQAQSTGTSLAFDTFVVVPNDNTDCCCSSPTTIQIINPTDAEETFTFVHVCVDRMRIC